MSDRRKPKFLASVNSKKSRPRLFHSGVEIDALSQGRAPHLVAERSPILKRARPLVPQGTICEHNETAAYPTITQAVSLNQASSTSSRPAPSLNPRASV